VAEYVYLETINEENEAS